MKCIGMIGGMSWESTARYYRIINEAVRDRLGALHSAPVLLHSLEFGEIAALQEHGEWERLEKLISASAVLLAQAGAELLLICSNTMHAVAGAVSDAISIPLLHIADAAGKAVYDAGMQRVGLLGTKFTLDSTIYSGRFFEAHGITVLLPQPDEQQFLHELIFGELCRGVTSEAGRSGCLTVIEQLASRGAEGIILGCTELPLLCNNLRVPVPLFDTTALHARSTVDIALS